MIFPSSGMCTVYVKKSYSRSLTKDFQLIQQTPVVQCRFPILIRNGNDNEFFPFKQFSPLRPVTGLKVRCIGSNVIDIELVLEDERMRSEDGNLGIHYTIGWDKSKTGSHQSILTVHGINPFEKRSAMFALSCGSC